MLLLLAIIATTPLELRQQIAVGLLMLCASLLIRRIPRPAVAPVLMTLSLIASSRCIWWRLTRTLDLSPGIEFSLGVGLLAAEIYSWTILVLGYLQNARPTGISTPASVPRISNGPPAPRSLKVQRTMRASPGAAAGGPESGVTANAAVAAHSSNADIQAARANSNPSRFALLMHDHCTYYPEGEG
jgi:hypothetical protein